MASNIPKTYTERLKGMVPTFFTLPYQWPGEGSLLTTEQIRAKLFEVNTIEVWDHGADEPYESDYYSWDVADGTAVDKALKSPSLVICANNLDGRPQFYFEVERSLGDFWRVNHID